MACFSAANSLEFQAKQQIKPYQEEEFVLEFVGDETHRSRKRKFVLACSDFRCESCDSSPLRCYSCSSLTNVATKKYRDTRSRILFVLGCFANKQTRRGQTVDEKFDWAEREVLKAISLYSEFVSPNSSNVAISTHLRQEANRKIRTNLVELKAKREATNKDIDVGMATVADVNKALLTGFNERQAEVETLMGRYSNLVDNIDSMANVGGDSCENVPVDEGGNDLNNDPGLALHDDDFELGLEILRGFAGYEGIDEAAMSTTSGSAF